MKEDVRITHVEIHSMELPALIIHIGDMLDFEMRWEFDQAALETRVRGKLEFDVKLDEYGRAVRWGNPWVKPLTDEEE